MTDRGVVGFRAVCLPLPEDDDRASQRSGGEKQHQMLNI